MALDGVAYYVSLSGDCIAFAFRIGGQERAYYFAQQCRTQ